jgi:rhodanese-related sulfurtransferase
MHTIFFKLLATTFLLTAALTPAFAAEEFPLRAKYPMVKTISTEALTSEYHSAIIIDVRSRIEYDVVHINKALYIPVALSNFVSELEKARRKTAAEPLAFYCNGYDCAKSFQAVQAAMEAGFENVFCYDAGIYKWTVANPQLATLMGTTPAKPEKLIAQETFLGRKIGYAEFARLAAKPDSMVIDIREPFQRAEDPNLPQHRTMTLAGVRNIPSDRLVPLLQKGEFKGKRLLITDAVGKQVQWMQFHLEEHGYRDYHFLENGVLSAVEAGAVR